MLDEDEKRDEGGTLRYDVPFKGAVLVNIEGMVTVEVPSHMPSPEQVAARAVILTLRDRVFYNEPIAVFRELLPACVIEHQTIGWGVDTPEPTDRAYQESDLQVLADADAHAEEVQS